MVIALPHKDIQWFEVDLSGDRPYPGWLVHGPRGERWGRLTQWSHGWEMTRSQWSATAAGYEADPDDFHAAWHYLDGHPMFWQFREHRVTGDVPENHYRLLDKGQAFARMSIDVLVTRTDAGVEVWLEAGKRDLVTSAGHPGHWHDIDLDTGASTYEQAVCKLAWLVWDKYGNDRRVADAPSSADAAPESASTSSD